jgi:hypothetical protein
MWLRSALFSIAFAVATYSSGEAGQKPPADRTAASDHARCIRNGFAPDTAGYFVCREQLLTARAEQQSDANDALWLFRNSHGRACRFWGYEPGTAEYTDCLKRYEYLERNSGK